MKNKFVILLVGIFLFLIFPLVSSSTTVLDSEAYVEGSTATLEMTITTGNEKNQAYTVTWKNATGYVVDTSTGTTPSSTTPPLNEFFESFTINSSYISIYGNALNATLLGDNLAGQSNATISAATSSDLLIVDIVISTENFIGTTLAISAKVKNGTEIGTAGASCRIDIETIGGNTVVSGIEEISNHNGDLDVDFEIDSSHFIAGVQYLADINCFCEIGDGRGCSNAEDGASGEGTKGFLIDDLNDFMINKKWANTTGFHDDFTASQGMYPAVYLKDEFGGKIQITDGPTRINQEDISWGTFNNSVEGNKTTNGQGFLTGGKPASLCLLLNNTFTEEKFIFVNEVSFDDDTLEQHFFPISLDTGETLQGESIIMRTSVKPQIDEGVVERCSEEFLLPTHVVGGNDFDINFHLHLEEFEQELELESDEFNFYGHEIGTPYIKIIDVVNVTTSAFDSSINACNELEVNITYDYFGVDETKFIARYCFENTDRDVIAGCIEKRIETDAGASSTINDTITLPYFKHAGTSEVDVSFFEETDRTTLIGFADVEPYNTFTIVVNNSDSCRYSENLALQSQQRQASALEGIENKTGTFHLAVDCPAQASAGSEMTCSISAQVEDSQVVEKEVDFTCYLNDGVNNYNSFNFNQMINKTLLTVNKTILIPSSFTATQSYVFQCEARYYNLGSRTDKFFDTFVISSSGSSSYGGGSGGRVIDNDEGKGPSITGGIIGIPDDIEEYFPFGPKGKVPILFIGFISLLAIIILAVIAVRKRKREPHNYHKSNFGGIIKTVFIIIISLASIIALLLAIYYGSSFLIGSLSNNVNTQENLSILFGSFTKLILLIGFIVLMIIILFKSLNIRGEIKFGNDHFTRGIHEDRKTSKMQQKLNRMILKDEIKREKLKKYYKVRKVNHK